MNLKDLHQAICSTLKEEIPAIQTCEIYPAIRKELVAPAVFVELASLEPGKDPGTEELALKARFEARIVIDSTIENAPLIVRTLAAEVAKVVNKNTWNIKNVSPGEFISAEIDGFRPELDAYLVWMVDWSHQLHLGKSIWTENKIKPHTIIIEENVRDPNYGLASKERHRNRGLFRLHGIGNQNRKNMN